MDTEFNADLRAHLTLDDGRVRHIQHTHYYPSDSATPRAAADAYVRAVSGVLDIPFEQLDQLMSG